jgi:WD40 repeat protein
MKAHRRLNKLTPLAAILSGILLTNIATAAPIKIAEVKRAEPVDFDKEIVPMLEASCTSCHNVIVDEGGLNLETVKSILKGGKKGAVVVPGKPEASRLLQLAAHQKNPVMPPKNNDVEAPNLTPEQLGILKLWIAAGAKEGSGKSSAPIVWKPLPNLVQPIYSVSVTPDGTYAAAGRSNQVYIYEVATGRMLTKLTDPEIMKSGLYSESGFAHYDIVQSVAFSPDGLTLATSGFRTVKLWKRPENVQISKWQAPAAATTFATTSDAKFIALPVDGNQVKIFEAATGKEHKTLAGHTGTVKTLAFTPDNAKLVTGSEDKTIRVWDLASSKAVGQINTTGPVNALVVYNEGKNIAATGADNNIRTWETPAALPENEEPTKELATLSGHSQPINTLIPVPTAANQFLSGAKDGQMKLWDGTKAVRSFAHTGNVTAVAVSPDGQRFASVSESNTARIFDAAGKQIAEVSGDHRAQRELASITHALSRTTGKIGKTKSALQAAEKDLPTKEKTFNEKKAAKEKAEGEAKTKKDAFDKVKTQKDEADKLAVTTSEVTIKAEEDVKAKTAAKTKTDADAKAKKDALDKLKAQKATADKAVTAALAVTTKAEATFKTAAAELAKATEAHAKAVADLQAAQAELDKDKENADKKKKVADLTAAVAKADTDKKAKDANSKNQEKARNDAKAKSDAATTAAKALEKPIADATAALTAADAAKKKGDTDLAASTK